MENKKKTTSSSDIPEFQRIKLRPVPQVKRKAPQPPTNLALRKTSSTTKTTTLTTPAKLYGKDLSEYDEVDVEALLAQLSPEEINILAKEVDPDDSFLPPDQRCSYECTKESTGPLNRKKLIEHINKQAIETPDEPEFEPYVKGTVRGKKWVPPPRDVRELEAEEKIAIDMGEEYEQALSDATQEEIIDLAAILGFHSMMNQDQYHASLLNKGQPVGLGWDGITKSTQQKVYPMDPPNNTDVDESIKRVKEDDSKLIELNLNNIKNISDEKLEQLIEALPQNEHLEVLSLTNVGLTDKTALLLAEAIEKSKTLRVLNVETNFISPPVIVKLVKALLKCRTIEEFRASNQRSQVLGNKIEMEITDLVEKNTSLLRLGLHLEFNDARHRVAAHLQRNIDRSESDTDLVKSSSSPPPPPLQSIQASLSQQSAAFENDKIQMIELATSSSNANLLHNENHNNVNNDHNTPFGNINNNNGKKTTFDTNVNDNATSSSQPSPPTALSATLSSIEAYDVKEKFYAKTADIATTSVVVNNLSSNHKNNNSITNANIGNSICNNHMHNFDSNANNVGNNLSLSSTSSTCFNAPLQQQSPTLTVTDALVITKIVRVQKLKPNLPKLILPPANIGVEYIAPPSVTPSPSPSPIPRIDYDVEVDPDNMVIRGGALTPSPSPSPQPPQEDYEVEVDPDNMVIRGGGNNVFDYDFDYEEDQSNRLISSSSSSTSMRSNSNAANLNDMPAYNEDLTSYKSHT
ncbi:Tropomodulin [Lucilia cuprina]|nr:Tropomodulin [Lucilia cuprina]